MDGRALSALDRVATSTAFFSALLECLVFLVRRLRNCALADAQLLVYGTSAEHDLDEAGRKQAAEKLVATQFNRSWEALNERRLRVEADTAASLMVKSLNALHQLDQSKRCILLPSPQTVAHRAECGRSRSLHGRLGGTLVIHPGVFW